jgi:hypothetical protein
MLVVDNVRGRWLCPSPRPRAVTTTFLPYQHLFTDATTLSEPRDYGPKGGGGQAKVDFQNFDDKLKVWESY